jgi:pilus assembly protein CpaB
LWVSHELQQRSFDGRSGATHEKVEVVVATTDILKDTIIDESMLTTEKVPKKFLQPGSVTNIDQIIGRFALTTIKNGQQILDANLIKYTESYLAHEIPSGMRAITIAVTDITGVAGLIKPGNFIDILVTYQYGDKQTVDKRTKTIFQNVKVLAVDKNLTKISNPLAQSEEVKKEVINQRKKKLQL